MTCDLDLSDLLRVGPEKPLGYLGFRPNDPRLPGLLQTLFVDRKLSGLIAPERYEDRIWLWAYHPEAMRAFVVENSLTLLNAGVTPTVSEFIHYVMTKHCPAEQQPKLYACIGRAFADPRFTQK